MVVGRFGAFIRDGVERPWLFRGIPVGGEEPKAPVSHRDEFRFAVVCDVAHFRGFVVNFCGYSAALSILRWLFWLEVEVEVEDAVVGDLKDISSAVTIHIHHPALK